MKNIRNVMRSILLLAASFLLISCNQKKHYTKVHAMSNAMSFMALITEYSSNNRDSLSPENLDELNLFIAKNGKTENVDTVYYCDEEKKYLWEYLGAKRMHIGITTKAEVVFKSPIKISGFYLFGYTDGSLQWKENDLPEHHADNPSSPE